MCANKNNENASDRSSFFVPFASLTQRLINSIVSVTATFRKPNFDYSERTLLIFLLEIYKKLKEIEHKTGEGSTDMDQAQNIRRWLVNVNKQPINWRELRTKYEKFANKNCDEMARYYQSASAEPYFELKIESVSCSMRIKLTVRYCSSGIQAYYNRENT